MKKSNVVGIEVMKYCIFIVFLTGFNLILWMGVVTPDFGETFNPWYRGVSIGLMNLLYFMFVPAYTKVFHGSIKYGHTIASILSFSLSALLLFVVFPLQV